MKTKIDLMNRLTLMMKTNKNPELVTIYKSVEESRSVKEVNAFKKRVNVIIKNKKVDYKWDK